MRHSHLCPTGSVARAGLRFEMLAVPTNAEVLAIVDLIMHQIVRRLAKTHADARVGLSI